MANSTTTNLAALQSQIVQEAIFTASERSIMRGLVNEFAVPLNSGATARVPVYPTKDAVAVAEGTDLTGTAGNVSVATTTKDIAISEVGIMTNLTDLARDTSEQNVVAHLGRVFGDALAKKMDADLIGLFTGFSTEKGPGAGAELTIQDLFEAAAELRANSAPGAYYGVFHPKQIFNVKKALTNTFSGANNLSNVGNEAMMQGYVGMIAGIQIFESANVSVDGSDDSIGAVFAKDAMGIAIQGDMNIEIQRDASLRADEIVATMRYGVSELIDAYGVKLTADTLAN